MCTFLIGLCATFHQKQLQDSSAEEADAGADANDVTAASLDNMVSTLTDYPSSWMDGPAEYVTRPKPPPPQKKSSSRLTSPMSSSSFPPPSPRCLPRHERMRFLLHCVLPCAALSRAGARHGSLPSKATVHIAVMTYFSVCFSLASARCFPWRSAPLLFLIGLAPLVFAGSMTRSKATWSAGREQTRRARTSCPRGLAWPTHRTFLR
jgi:hypothetical protein